MGEIHEISTKIEVKFDLMRAVNRRQAESKPVPPPPPAPSSEPAEDQDASGP